MTDFQMPGRNGVELIEAVRTTKKDLPAILMTAYLHVYDRIDEERRREITLLRKPFDADEILRLVALGLDKSRDGKAAARGAASSRLDNEGKVRPGVLKA